MLGLRKRWAGVLWVGLAAAFVGGVTVLLIWWFSPAQRVRRLVQEVADLPRFDEISFRLVRSSKDINRDFLSLGKRAVPPLVDLLGHPDGRFRQIAARKLALLKDADAVPALIAAMSDPDELVRAGAAEALGAIGDPRAGDALLAALDDKDGWVRSFAASGLGTIGEKRAVGPLIKAVETKSALASGARALAMLRAVEALPTLIRALDEPEDFIRNDVAIAVGQLRSPEAVPHLINGLLRTANYPGKRLEIIDVLVQLRDPRGRAALGQAASTDISEEVREAARKALVAFGDAPPSTGPGPGR